MFTRKSTEYRQNNVQISEFENCKKSYQENLQGKVLNINKMMYKLANFKIVRSHIKKIYKKKFKISTKRCNNRQILVRFMFQESL